jgi:hypothetical protein
LKPQLIDFKPEHLADQADGAFKAANGVGWTAVIGEQIIGSAGVLLLWGKDGGVGEAWIINWPRTKSLAIWFHKTIKAKLAEVVRTYRLWRMQANVCSTDRQARQWIEAVGFLKEGLALNFMPDGQDVVRYYRLYRENLPL